ncbi:LacI family DNA-binding transcriptional regulator [Sinirhodobacter sp. WL0062]|uniref:LacI family DNA-binding transcriptional regulator n=1 Tax=Rhodobacter flavimaris TaxID=2907145 RepID=A0ABS8Z1Q6_9RHOB|nr:LacI family DNA-binding transcriptional regulator [Sinirhodobacter sp. WL0062]MCE5974882.1 LacI family DNA-binding transcriptional regulator [Sinirhodobacter sp. WL0062]
MSRPTIADLAREAGVSVATVDRVLNGRLKVREETARRVQEAAARIGYHGANAIRARLMAELPELRFALILQKERHPFYQNFARIFQERVEAITTHRLRLTLKFAQSTLPGELAQILTSLAGKVDAVAATGIDHHEVTAAVSLLRQRGIPTFSMLSDFAQGVRESYIGVNNLKAGRAVGWMLSRVAPRPGKIAIFIGGHRFHGHELRETGVRSYFREYAPQFELLNAQANLETRQLTYEATIELLQRHPDLVGIYCAGGGMEGAIAAVREERRPGDVALIVNELTPDSTEALQDGTVTLIMGTPLQQLCEELVTIMIHSVENGMAENPGQRFLPFQLWTPESL